MAVALVVAGLTVGMAPAAFAPTAVENVTGHWAGFYRSNDNPDQRGGMTLDVSMQSGRRFTGDICGMVSDGCVPVEGTIAESGEMSILGRSSQVRNLTIEGALEPLYGRFGITMADGSRQKGDVVAVHQVPAIQAPSFAGSWSGGATAADGSVVPVEGSFTQDRGGAIGGHSDWDGRRFDIAAQVPPSTGERQGLLLVGGSADALVTMALEETSGSGRHLEGSYRMVREVDPSPAPSEEGSIVLSQAESTPS